MYTNSGDRTHANVAGKWEASLCADACLLNQPCNMQRASPKATLLDGEGQQALAKVAWKLSTKN